MEGAYGEAARANLNFIWYYTENLVAWIDRHLGVPSSAQSPLLPRPPSMEYPLRRGIRLRGVTLDVVHPRLARAHGF